MIFASFWWIKSIDCLLKTKFWNDSYWGNSLNVKPLLKGYACSPLSLIPVSLVVVFSSLDIRMGNTQFFPSWLNAGLEYHKEEEVEVTSAQTLWGFPTYSMMSCERLRHAYQYPRWIPLPRRISSCSLFVGLCCMAWVLHGLCILLGILSKIEELSTLSCRWNPFRVRGTKAPSSMCLGNQGPSSMLTFHSF